jgi:hypothetical protein
VKKPTAIFLYSSSSDRNHYTIVVFGLGVHVGLPPARRQLADCGRYTTGQLKSGLFPTVGFLGMSCDSTLDRRLKTKNGWVLSIKGLTSSVHAYAQILSRVVRQANLVAIRIIEANQED